MSDTQSCNRTKLTLFGLIIAVGMIASSFIVSQALVEIKSANQTITVKGYAERTIDSDLAVWRGSFAVISKDLASGYAQVESDLTKVLAYLEANGIPRDALDISAVSSSALYVTTVEGTTTNQIEGYRLYQSVEVKSNDVPLIDRVSKQSSVLIKDNIGWESGMPEFYYTKVDDLKVSMLGEAAKDARRRADQLAESSGNAVGVLRSAQQGVFQITAENSASISDYGEYNTTSIRKSIKAVVTMQYSVR